MSNITVTEATIKDACLVHEAIPEFIDTPLPGLYEDRKNDATWITLIASVEGIEAGYLVAYDRDGDGSLYCWMIAVKPDFRRHTSG